MGNADLAPTRDELALVEQWARSLAECRDLDKLRTIRDKAEALRAYFKKVDQSQRSQNAAAEVKIRAERQIGDVLEKIEKNAGGRPPRNPLHRARGLPSYGQLDIEYTFAHRCQAIHEVPEDEFERIIAEAVKDNRELTSRELYLIGLKRLRHKKRRKKLEAAAALATGGNGRVARDAPRSWEIRCGCCLDLLPEIGDGEARLIFADPPYNIGIEYGDHYDDDRPPEEFEAECRAWITEAARALTPDGSLWLLVNHEWSARLRLAAEEIGLHWRQTLTWYESFGVNTTRMFNRCSRPLIWFVKDPDHFAFRAEAREIRRPSDRQAKYDDARADPDGKVWDDVWGINPPIPRLTDTCAERLPDFPTQLPIRLLRPIVACASDLGDLVVDPFCGSGTTGAACIELGRRFVGIELSEEYAELARLRLTAQEGGDRDEDVES